MGLASSPDLSFDRSGKTPSPQRPGTGTGSRFHRSASFGHRRTMRFPRSRDRQRRPGASDRTPDHPAASLRHRFPAAPSTAASVRSRRTAAAASMTTATGGRPASMRRSRTYQPRTAARPDRDRRGRRPVRGRARSPLAEADRRPALARFLTSGRGHDPQPRRAETPLARWVFRLYGACGDLRRALRTWPLLLTCPRNAV